MPANFLHGIEVTEVSSGPVPVTVVNSAVIGLIGTAPQWMVAADAAVLPPASANTPTLIGSSRGASQFGPLVRGYTIPYALAAIQAQGAAQVIVVNVFDPSTHQTTVSATTFTMPATGNQVINLKQMGLIGPGLPNSGTLATTVVVKESSGGTTYVEGTDYTVDYVNGFVSAKTGGTIATGASLSIGYSYADPSKVADTDIVGAVTSGAYTGMQCLLTTFQSFGLNARLLIAPGFADDATTASAMTTLAGTLRAMAFIDAAPSTGVAAAIADRGTSGQAFDTSSYRCVLCFPQENFFDAGIVTTGATMNNQGAVIQALYSQNADSPYSQWVAGATAAQDIRNGYWFSPSNTQVNGIVGPDVTMYSSAFDSASDTNQLNAAGILTVFNGFGTGLRVWGNRSAAYPTYTDAAVFIPIRRTMDVVEASVQQAMLQFLDRPIDNGLINSILATVNGFLRTLIQRGALIGGQASYNPAENSAVQLAAGQLTFDISLMPPPPAERIDFNVSVNTALLNTLGPSQAAATA
ncbi:MAG: phage tail sheath family protein [Acetobacteraceae bacterium]